VIPHEHSSSQGAPDPRRDYLPAEVERAVALGATKVAEFDEYETRWATLTDPEGNVFDIGVGQSPAEPAA